MRLERSSWLGPVAAGRTRSMLAEYPPSGPPMHLRFRVLEIIAGSPGISTAELRAALLPDARGRHRLNNALHDLKAAGLITSAGYGRYQITPRPPAPAAGRGQVGPPARLIAGRSPVPPHPPRTPGSLQARPQADRAARPRGRDRGLQPGSARARPSPRPPRYPWPCR